MRQSRRLRRGIYLLPTLFTLGNLFCGFSSLLQAARGHFEIAAALVVIAAVLDGLDGRIARLTGTTSAFGVEFDSMADVVSFGVVPAMLAYHWGLHASGIGWLIAFLYVVCASMRLARFNIGAKAGQDKRHFIGLPSPMAGTALAGVVYAFPALPASRGLALALSLLVFALAVLMVSRLRYRSFREFDLRNRRSYLYVLPVAALLVVVAYHPQTALLVLGGAYVLWGPGQHLLHLVTHGASDGRREGAAAKTEVADGPPIP